MKILKRKKQETPTSRTTRDPSTRSAPVFSYYSNRSTDNEVASRTPQKTQPRTKNRPGWVYYLPSIISLIIVAFALGYLTTLATNPRVVIAASEDQPAVVQPVSVYEKASADLIKGSILNRSKLTINTDKLASKLEDEFPELGDIIVTIPLISRRPIIETKPTTPKLILTGKGGSFVIDNRGIPVLRANQLASSLRDSLPMISDSSDSEIQAGKQLLTTELVSFIETIDAQLTSKDLQVETYSLPTLANELHVKLAGKGYYIKFNTEVDARQQVGTYLATQERLDSEGKIPSEYIDVRVEERAYIK